MPFLDITELKQYPEIDTFIHADDENLNELYDNSTFKPKYELTLAELGKKSVSLEIILASLGFLKHLNIVLEKNNAINKDNVFKAAVRSGQAAVVIDLLSKNEVLCSNTQLIIDTLKTAQKYHHQSVINELLPILIASAVDTPKDGNCFFHAILAEAKRQGLPWSYFTHDALRRKCVTYLRTNIHLFNHFFTDQEPFTAYESRMIRIGEWADGPIIEGFARSFGVNLKIIDINDNEQNQMSIMQFDEDMRASHISLLRKDGHYTPILMQNKFYPKQPINHPISNIEEDIDLFLQSMHKQVSLMQDDLEKMTYRLKAKVMQKTSSFFKPDIAVTFDPDSPLLSISDIEHKENELADKITLITISDHDPSDPDKRPVAERAVLLSRAKVLESNDDNANTVRCISLQLASCYILKAGLTGENYISMCLSAAIACSKAAYEVDLDKKIEHRNMAMEIYVKSGAQINLFKKYQITYNHLENFYGDKEIEQALKEDEITSKIKRCL